MPGLLISFDGTDSSGKATQVKLLEDRLSTAHQIGHFETPDYTTETGKQLKALFQGKAGSWDDLTWREQMALLATNRAEHKQEVLDILHSGGVVIYDRYVPSSIAHMIVDALSPEEVNSRRAEITQAVSEHEYVTNAMPRENISFFLDVPPSLAHSLLAKRKQEHGDPDEATDHIELQERIYAEYQWLTKNDPDKYIRIDCLDGGELLPPPVIANQVWQHLTNIFPKLSK